MKKILELIVFICNKILRYYLVRDSKKYLSSTDGILSLYKTPIGDYFLPNFNPKDQVFNTMKIGEVFEPEIVDVAKEFIKPNTVVLDIGAHLGQMSLEFSKFVGKDGKVYSFEADNFIYSVLNKNVEINKCDNIRTVFGAVYNNDGEELFYPEPDFERFGNYGSYGINLQATQGRTVKTLTIDSLGITDPISFMKVDIQGSDLYALEGARQTILKNKMPIIFEFEQPLQKEFNTTFQDYVGFVESINYRFERVVMEINYLILPK